MNDLIRQLKIQIIKLKIQLYSLYLKNYMEQTLNGIKIYQKAKSLLGLDITPKDTISDIYSCAETVNMIVELAIGRQIGGGASTRLMYESLKDTSRFLQVETPLAGDVIISPTGQGNGNILHGHCGIIGNFGIMSNNSDNGLLQEKLTLDIWKYFYGRTGGFPVLFYRVL